MGDTRVTAHRLEWNGNSLDKHKLLVILAFSSGHGVRREIHPGEFSMDRLWYWCNVHTREYLLKKLRETL